MNDYRRIDFSDVALYAVTPEPTDPAATLATAEKLLAGGVDAIQLRARKLADRDFIALGKKMKELCAKHSALFLVNNRVDLALAIDADGLHLGHEDVTIEFARELFGHRKIIGISTHSLPEAIDAQKRGADYVSCGPLWATPTKPEYKPVGIPLVGLYKAALRIPFVAIGSIDETNFDQVIATGATRVAMVRALFEAKDPQKTAAAFKQKISNKILI